MAPAVEVEVDLRGRLAGFVNPSTGRVIRLTRSRPTTGRLSSSEPNLQNIPVRTEAGRKIRRAFVAPNGRKLISADYSQIELRLLAHLADIAALKSAFAEGLDIHAMTASEIFGVPIKGMPAEVRRRAKAINFGIIYGISAFGLANQLGIAPRGGRRLYPEIFRALPRHPRLHGGDQEGGPRERLRHHHFRTRMHTRASTPESSERAFNERAAINAPLQGSAADIIRRAMTYGDGAGGRETQRADAVAGARRTRVRGARRRVEATLPVVDEVMVERRPAIKLHVPLQGRRARRPELGGGALACRLRFIIRHCGLGPPDGRPRWVKR